MPLLIFKESSDNIFKLRIEQCSMNGEPLFLCFFIVAWLRPSNGVRGRRYFHSQHRLLKTALCIQKKSLYVYTVSLEKKVKIFMRVCETVTAAKSCAVFMD